jgi:plasmid stabilization system protein ParE
LILGDQPAAARRFLRAFAEICEKLQGAPLMGVARENDLKIPGLRSVRMPGFANYLVFYMIQEGQMSSS